MLNNATISLIGHAVGVGVIAFSTAPSILHIGQKAGSNKQVEYEALYEDKDGVATSESEAKYSVKWPRIIASVGTGLGIGCSIAFSILSTLNHVKASVSGVTFAKDWATTLAWVSGKSLVLGRFIISFDMGRFQSQFPLVFFSLILPEYSELTPN